MKKEYGYQIGVYQIRNLLNGKIYVGQTARMHERELEHKGALRRGKHENRHLQSAYDLYGKENFVFEILVFCETFELTRYEDAIKNASNGNCYNIRPCSDSNKGLKASEETRAKMRANSAHAVLGRPHTEEEKRHLSEVESGENSYWFGKHHTDNAKKKISLARTGTHHSEQQKQKQSEFMRGNKYNLGKKHSDEEKLKRSEEHIGYRPEGNYNSKYVGLHLDKRDTKYYVNVFFEGKARFCVGSTKYETEGALMYNDAMLDLYGWKAKLNDISQEEIDALWEME
jgi:group I intron endonuclease